MRLLPVLCAIIWCLPAAADTLRVAVFTAELDRKGPGLLLRDILSGEDPQVTAAARVIAAVDADVLVLLRFDYDHAGVALGAFAAAIGEAGASYPHRFSLPPNSGRATGLDLDGDGRLRGPRDAQGYGLFAGQNGMAVLSRHPVLAARARDFSDLPWRDLPNATLPLHGDGAPFPSAAAHEALLLFSTAAWDVPVRLPGGGTLSVLAFHATPPVFDGPEDRNGLRNRDELRFWRLLLDGALAGPLELPAPAGSFVLAGNANLDPVKGEGHRAAIADLLSHPALGDPAPSSAGARAAGRATDTVDWSAEGEPGNMRVDYVLPSADLRVAGAGVLWPAEGEPEAALLGEDGRGASRHRIVWVDIHLPAGVAAGGPGG